MSRQEKPLRTGSYIKRKIKAMTLATEKENILDSIISSYEARIQSIEAFFDTTGQIFQDFQDPLLNTRTEWEKINSQLRENLAQNGSLRKKDFDRMMGVISSHLDESEQGVRQLFQKYLNEHTKLVQQLRKGLREFKDALIEGHAQEIKELRILIKKNLSKQDESRNEVTSKLKEFQQGQQQTSKMLRDLLAKGEKLRIRDFKEMIVECKKQREQRIAYQERRREEVRDMLGKFKAERTQAEQERLAELREA
jgi:uncharacterized phage infection (PIP) family protein YhgE